MVVGEDFVPRVSYDEERFTRGARREEEEM